MHRNFLGFNCMYKNNIFFFYVFEIMIFLFFFGNLRENRIFYTESIYDSEVYGSILNKISENALVIRS